MHEVRILNPTMLATRVGCWCWLGSQWIESVNAVKRKRRISSGARDRKAVVAGLRKVFVRVVVNSQRRHEQIA